MNEQFWIRIIVRVLGAVGMFYVLWHWLHIYHRTGNVHFAHGSLWKLVVEIGLMLLGVYMLRGAPLFVKFISPKDKNGNGQN
ncbi:MAG: hypothetical protein RLZZ350_2242 [Verrucomicrobiota bacterium]|jgi:hypothetical protein